MSYEYIFIAILLLSWLVSVIFYTYAMAQRQFQSRGKKIKKSWLQYLVRNGRLSPIERIGAPI